MILVSVCFYLIGWLFNGLIWNCIVFWLGKRGFNGRTIAKYSTASAVEDPITPSVKVNYNQLLINGQFVDSVSGLSFFENAWFSLFETVFFNRFCLFSVNLGKTFPTLDPRSGEVIANVAEGDARDVDIAVSAARKAFDEGPWPKMTAYVSSSRWI